MENPDSEHYYAQDELQRRAGEQTNSPYAPQMFEQVQQAQAILVEQTNPQKTVERVILRLRGKDLMPNGTEVRVSEPKMNDKGIEKISFILSSHINQNIILSHLEPEQIAPLMNSLSDDLVDNLALNWREYGIKDKTDLDDINNSILINIFAALKRAEGQNEKNWLGKISIEQISGQPHFGKQKKEGFWDKFRL